MANLLRQGATLTDLSCPACSAPLFRFKDNTLWCEQDQKKVIIAKENTQIQTTPQTNTAYDKLESTLLTKIQAFEEKIEKTEDPEEIQKLSTALSELLNSLEKVRKIKTNT
jgi:uncharacterized Zn finger protein (UPF0148 family)